MVPIIGETLLLLFGHRTDWFDEVQKQLQSKSQTSLRIHSSQSHDPQQEHRQWWMLDN